MTAKTDNWEVDIFVDSALSDVFWDRASTDADAPVIEAAYKAGALAVERANSVAGYMSRDGVDGIDAANVDAIQQVWGATIAGAAYVAGVQARRTLES